MSANIVGYVRNHKSVHQGKEPLKRFAEAKKFMGDIYADLEAYIDELTKFYRDVINGQTIVPDEQMQEVEKFKGSISTIRDMFMRDTMKVAFFGRTSNGKSSVINAMLHSKILPQGMGHTTCCFIQVEGSPDNEKYIISENSTSPINISELQRLASAVSDDNASMGQDSLLHVLYPKSESRLLQNDVVIVDSPGVDFSPEFDNWIDKHCLDADVFVLVCNAESTLTQSEKNFFHRVSSKLSKPNIFILNNRWDASAAEMEHMQQVKEQHMIRFKEFLVNELNVCSEHEAKDRIFFISAREMLDARLKERNLIKIDVLFFYIFFKIILEWFIIYLFIAYQMEGHQFRAMEFMNFETQFEQTISKSAISTKFESHHRRAREIVNSMRGNLEIVQINAVKRREQLQQNYCNREEEFKQGLNSWKEFERFAITESQRLKNEVHLKVSADYYEEIFRLESIIDKFDGKFIDEPSCILQYKKADSFNFYISFGIRNFCHEYLHSFFFIPLSLADFLDKVVKENLEIRCTGGLMQRIWNLENNMFEQIGRILPEPYSRKLDEVWRYRAPFRFTICVNCPSLMEDFHEDLIFRFSLGLPSLIRRFIAFRSGQPVTAISNNYFLQAFKKNELTDSGGEATSSQSNQVARHEAEIFNRRDEDNALITQVVLSSVGYIANGGVGLLVIGGLVSRTVGWRIIAVSGLLYGGLYALEWWRWNSGAKEQHLKDQFRSHLATRMRNMAASHTSNCESQVLWEMQQVFNGLKATVGGAHQEMKNELDETQQKIGNIENVIKGLNTIKGKTAFLNTDLDRFDLEFLQADSLSP
ncbi:unnamed protein product [Dracunculus medinensis]|uniref:Dynamin-type G domain-containing protein n=1 Tax=Dracunculus medinensis TaxID=318479 RepID=A0A0N4UFD0_DRAME|nr:unnamed protein product [Dracunculus medinensis]